METYLQTSCPDICLLPLQNEMKINLLENLSGTETAGRKSILSSATTDDNLGFRNILHSIHDCIFHKNTNKQTLKQFIMYHSAKSNK